MSNESWSKAVDKEVWEKEEKLVLYSVILIFIEWIIKPSLPWNQLQLYSWKLSLEVKT